MTYYNAPEDRSWSYPATVPPNRGGNGAPIAVGVVIAFLLLVLVGMLAFFVGRGQMGSEAGSSQVATVVETQTLQPATNGGSNPGAAAPASPKSSCNYSTYWSATSVTSEGFAANVYLAILDACNNAGGPNVTVEAYSPTTGRTYAMSCSGTTVVTCRGGDNAVVKIS